MHTINRFIYILYISKLLLGVKGISGGGWDERHEKKAAARVRPDTFNCTCDITNSFYFPFRVSSFLMCLLLAYVCSSLFFFLCCIAFLLFFFWGSRDSQVFFMLSRSSAGSNRRKKSRLHIYIQWESKSEIESVYFFCFVCHLLWFLTCKAEEEENAATFMIPFSSSSFPLLNAEARKMKMEWKWTNPPRSCAFFLFSNVKIFSVQCTVICGWTCYIISPPVELYFLFIIKSLLKKRVHMWQKKKKT